MFLHTTAAGRLPLAGPFVTLALGIALGGCGSHAAPAPPPPRPVRVIVAQNEPTSGVLRAVGVVAAKDAARLSFKTGGVIEEIRVEEGATIHRGQLLASLRSTEIDAQVRQAREAAQKASRDQARVRALFDDGVATQEQLDDSATLQATTRAALDAATFNARYARIEAPADGVVQRKLAQPNELVQPGQAVLVVSSLDRGWIVRVGVADRDVVMLKPGDPAQLSLDAFPGRHYAGRISTVGASADPQTGTFGVEVQVEPGGAALADGMVARVEFARTRAPGAVLPSVPLSALLEANGDAATIYVLDAAGAVAHRRAVRLGATGNGGAAIVAGLRSGERVVSDGAAFLTDGERVQVVAGANSDSP